MTSTLTLTSASGLPDLTGRTVIVTGAGSGIGLATAQALGAAHARVVLAVRNTAKGAAAAASIAGETVVRPLDLADLSSVRRFADEWAGPIDVLVNNAGVSSPTLQRTRDGFELQFGTNHLGPFALTNLLLPHITGRVVSLSSQAERTGRIAFDDLGLERTPYRESRVYAASKLANLLFITELQRRLTAAGSPVLAAAAHPGLVATPMTEGSGGAMTQFMVRHLAQSPEQGALPVLLAATADVPPGAFTGPQHAMHMRGGAQLIGRSKHSRDPELARRLWAVSEELTGVTFGL
ncbi:oxidoreductase [Paractinoplanes lichenicola]|uniref:SDR family NAD(P)-dependent oxidoreductase n=1 Tax=Paractinoplanes lichenicola TaxID=2802976 RepID=A0ABS1VPQ7_9ACTN|nr:oxidoreductase [Actinoplanes lichenicola]MBL7255511.1 SDR family NAD(P)-dependent oxidoreductase [Actinoplanes lichenicola]